MHEGQARQGVEYQLGQLTTAVESLSERVEDLDHKIFGNGREGVIAQHAREIDLIKDVLLERRIHQRLLRAAWHILGGLLSWSWLQMMWPHVKKLLGW